MACFLKLPLELQNMIYEYCLVVKGLIFPYPSYYEEDAVLQSAQRKPDVALVQVNKEIGTKAKKILYGNNVWHLSYDTSMHGLGQIWTVNSPIPHVETRFDVRDLHYHRSLEIAQEWNRKALDDDQIDGADKIKWAHRTALTDVWADRMTYLQDKDRSGIC